jgi:tyrosyl-tRNA synthetase
MNSRGLIAQVSNEQQLQEHLSSGHRAVYCGFDPTADSLHIGNLVPLLALRRFQLYGHTPILLIGGATGMIGDPGGKTSERDLKPAEQVRQFVDKIRVQASQFLDFECEDNAAILVDNAEWTEGLNVIEYLRDVGKHFSVNAMVQKETVRRRLQDDSLGISYTEFSYMILQSFDFVVLYRQYNCTIQVGGSDQWGNITSGIDLIRRMESGQAHALTYPLITKADGSKFGKSADGAVWLDPEKTSPYRFFQFWINSADADVLQYLRIFTFLDEAQLVKLDQAHLSAPEKRLAQQTLACEVTQLVHGQEGLEGAQRITRAIFSNDLLSLSEADFEQLAQDGLPRTTVNQEAVALLDCLVDSGLAITPKGQVTRGQARKLILSNAVSVNGVKQSDEDCLLDRSGALFSRYYLVQKGKKHHHLIVLGSSA